VLYRDAGNCNSAATHQVIVISDGKEFLFVKARILVDGLAYAVLAALFALVVLPRSPVDPSSGATASIAVDVKVSRCRHRSR